MCVGRLRKLKIAENSLDIAIENLKDEEGFYSWQISMLEVIKDDVSELIDSSNFAAMDKLKRMSEANSCASDIG